jgi:hypothetical protein
VPARTRLRPITLAAIVALALTGCGSGGASSGGSVASGPATSATTTASATPPATATAFAPATSAATSVTTRTESAPAFVTKPPVSGSSGLAAATASVTTRGYAVVDPAAWEPEHTLRVLLGSRGGSEQVFFFVAGRYIGTDSSQPSRALAVLHQANTTITIGYTTDTGQVPVDFHWTGARLVALEPIPATAARG